MRPSRATHMIYHKLARSYQKISRHRKDSLRCIPYLFTFANAIFGFLSIIYALEQQITLAACCLFCAAVMDAFDGRIARKLGFASQLGTELDSLCDAVSFCIAPMIIAYQSYLDVTHVGLIPLGIYVCMGLFRLASFNLTAHQSHSYFIGVPTPCAASIVTILSIALPSVLAGSITPRAIDLILMFLITLTAFSMISKIRIPSWK